MFCPAGSVAQENDDGTLTITSGASACVLSGIACTEGTYIPLSNDTVAPPGYYISEDNSEILECPAGAMCPGGPDAAAPQLCPPGQYQADAGAAECSTCTAGTVCPVSGGSAPELCPAGRVCTHPGRFTPTYLCPAGSYCLTGSITLNTNSSIVGAPIVCSEGTYCMLGTAVGYVEAGCTSCAQTCTPGTFCGVNTTDAGGEDNCPPGWYCPPGSQVPKAVPPGHYTSSSGAQYPSKCAPGTYASGWMFTECDPCPSGHECPLDGTVEPTTCTAGTYREETLPGEDPADNVNCKPCPQGTWSAIEGLVSVLQCKNCDERYYCPIEGTTIFATVEQPCAADEIGTGAICYENSQGQDCPQGFGCPQGTTEFSQADFPCEPGFWCKIRTIPKETRNLLCPEGYYCKAETGESGGSGRYAFSCPAGKFCPNGTAAIDDQTTLETTLYNVQSDINIILFPNSDTNAMCRDCPDDLPDGDMDESQCQPCGELHTTRRLLHSGALASTNGSAALGAQYGSPLRVPRGPSRRLDHDPSVCAPDITTDPPTPWEVGRPCYTAVEDWEGTLTCPRGTNSNIGSSDPTMCIQTGILIAVQNIYKCYPPRECSVGFEPNYVCKDYEVLCALAADGEDIERYKNDNTYKKSFMWGRLWDGVTVDFFAYDPVEDSGLHVWDTFASIKVEPMSIVILYLDFSNVPEGTLLNADGAGHYDIHIASDVEENGFNDMSPVTGRPHLLPAFFYRSSNSDLRFPVKIQILALAAFSFTVQLNLRHGGHLDALSTLHQSLDIRMFQPFRTEWGTTKFFATVLSRDLLFGRNILLPYNMLPGISAMSGLYDVELNTAMVTDAIDTGDLPNAPQTPYYDDSSAMDNIVTDSSAFWTSTNLETVAMPWLPFFSHCDTFDSHIVIWDLFEQPDYNSRGGPRDGCAQYTPETVGMVPTSLVDPTTLELVFSPVADNCSFVVKCRFEESLEDGFFSADPWWDIQEEELDVYYLTETPITFEQFNEQGAFFDAQVGEDSLVPVYIATDEKTARFPRKVNFDIKYYQATTDSKKIVSAETVMSEYDDDDTSNEYLLMLSFEALGWQDLMNKFQLPYAVYAFLYAIIGLGAVGFTVAFWIWFRVTSRIAQAPPFRWLECYEFMLWWPIQGVFAASIPVAVLWGVVWISFMEGIDVTASIPCSYADIGSGDVDDSETARCRAGRVGTCFLFGGLLILVSGGKLLVPRLRQVEEQFLLQQGAQSLDREGLPLLPEQRSLIRTVPIQWKRAHLVFISVLLVLPLMSLWEFTYADYFETNTIAFIVFFSFSMIPVEGALSRAAREELLEVPLSTACSVVLFIGTLGAEDFADFCEGFFIELIVGILDRLVLALIIKWTEENAKKAIRWTRSRQWFWQLLLATGASGRYLTQSAPEADVQEAELEEDVEGTPIEEAMEEIIGCGTTCMSTVTTPILIAGIMMFDAETQIAASYGIRKTDMICYLLFGVMIAPFQVMMDIIMNHATEVKHGVRIYDYMLYAKWRWNNRLTRWLYDDPRMDESIAEPLQSVNHLCFSPQFYFIECYYSWGILMLLLALTTLLRNGMNPFDDPAMFYFVVQQFAVNRILDRIVRVMTSNILWPPKQQTTLKTFSRSIAISLKKKDQRDATEKYQQYFLQRHSGWLVNQLGKVFTPRSQARYRQNLSTLYQQALQLQPIRIYRAPGPAFPRPVAHQELPPNLRLELEGDESSSDDEVLGQELRRSL
ncbi:unnamed protein product [Prorocentrum cordatum]|uniref:Uncharacterized protein n=1 Tax=Prorocentrum cordatum TaxID=2364126 RepID=A0ABN9RRQ8_9DINO|nr:unnamed protein product [Polarella glacialis]